MIVNKPTKEIKHKKEKILNPKEGRIEGKENKDNIGKNFKQ